jgi:polyhydroxybutyrate depolymerase
VYVVEHGGRERQYILHVPPGYSGGSPIPLVINLHGGGATAEMQRHSSQMNAASDRAGFLVAYPEGTGKSLFGRTVGTWNAGRCCGYAKEQNIDDVGFIRKLIDDIGGRYSLDRRRVYATGHSNGALMAYRLACELSDRIAAVAPNAAQDAFDNCRPTRPVPVLHFHGTDDPAARYEGGHCGGKTKDPGWSCRSVPDYLALWRRINSCSDTSKVVINRGAARCVSWSECKGGAAVELCTIRGAGHTWPDGMYDNERAGWKKKVGHLSRDINANDVMWEFFKRHPLP